MRAFGIKNCTSYAFEHVFQTRTVLGFLVRKPDTSWTEKLLTSMRNMNDSNLVTVLEEIDRNYVAIEKEAFIHDTGKHSKICHTVASTCILTVNFHKGILFL